ncbi:hypothetical protein FKP32DRAFT_1360990 [Trametes sanguinea]|nr:hypothetical protein FKP32DRAFT_1360990 [Trametes sanguinea]
MLRACRGGPATTSPGALCLLHPAATRDHPFILSPTMAICARLLHQPLALPANLTYLRQQFLATTVLSPPHARTTSEVEAAIHLPSRCRALAAVPPRRSIEHPPTRTIFSCPPCG